MVIWNVIPACRQTLTFLGKCLISDVEYKIEIYFAYVCYSYSLYPLLLIILLHSIKLLSKLKMSDTIIQTQSEGLRNRLATMHGGGQHLNDDSKGSEGILTTALETVVIPYAKELAAARGWKTEYRTKMNLYEMQCILQKSSGGDCPEPDPANKRVFMKPDGGILSVIVGDEIIPILITEDKKQGTNDSRFAEGKGRQATGNAVERGIKNIRAAEMLFHSGNVFPYVLFGSGCDFHPSETIAKRLEIGNYGAKNLEIAMRPGATEDEHMEDLRQLVAKINISKRYGGKSIATICIKSHKWDEMTHNASAWTAPEIAMVCGRTIELAFADLDTRFTQA